MDAKKAKIQKRLDHLPVKAADLSKWILIGKVKLKARMAALKAIHKLEDGMAAHAAALSDTQDLAEELLYAEARMGDLLSATPLPDKRSSSSKGTCSLPDGIDKKQSHHAQTLSRNMDKIADVVANAREAGEVPVRQHVLKAINVHVGRNSGENEWYTPQPYINAARTVMGSIDCDPATTTEANKRIKATKFYTKENSGLGKVWGKNVFLNPPYAQPHINHFCATFVHKYHSNEMKQGIVLINNITETDSGQLLLEAAAAVCFPSKRIKFLDIDGNPGGPLQGQMVLYFGCRQVKFTEEFGGFGVCLNAAKS